MIHTLALSPDQAAGLKARLDLKAQAETVAGTYFAALCDRHGLGTAHFMALEGTTLTVQVADPPESPA